MTTTPEFYLDQIQRFKKVFEIQRRITSESNIEKLATLVMRALSELIEVDRSTLFMFDPELTELRACFPEGVAENTIVVPLKMGVIGASILCRRTINIVNAYYQTYFNRSVDKDSCYKTDSILAVPIIDAQGRVIGGIELLNKRNGHFLATDEENTARSAANLAQLAQEGKLDKAAAQAQTSILREQTGCNRGAVFVLNEAAGQLVALHADELEDKQIALKINLGIAGLVAITGKTLLVADPPRDSRFDSSFDKLTGYHTRNILCVPLISSDGESLGVIEAINKLSGPFTAEDQELMEVVAGIVAIAIENRLLLRDSEHQFHSILATLAASIDARDALTAGHSLRVAEISVGVARELGYPADDTDLLRVAAILHDYGKIGVDDSVLRKNGKLDTEEYRHIKTHANKTFDILERIHFTRKYRAVPAIASAHHEALDGSGYPRGLLERDIPFMTKILTVADVYEALTAGRHYRKGMCATDAFAILDQGIGTKFDGNIVAALKKYLTNT